MKLKKKILTEIKLKYFFFGRAFLQGLSGKGKQIKFYFRPWLSLNAGQKYCRMLQTKILMTNGSLMKVASIAECLEHSAILATFIKLPFVIKIFVLSIIEWPFFTGFTVRPNIHLGIFQWNLCLPPYFGHASSEGSGQKSKLDWAFADCSSNQYQNFLSWTIYMYNSSKHTGNVII